MRITLSLKKQPTCRDATTRFPAKWCVKTWRRNSILMTCHYVQFPDKIFFPATTKTLNYANCLGMIQSYIVKYMQCDRCAWNKSCATLEYFRKQTLKENLSPTHAHRVLHFGREKRRTRNARDS